MRVLLLLAALAAPALAADAGVSAVPARPRLPFKKMMVIVLENTDYKEAMERPYFRELAKKGALLTDYHGVAHPSQPNYVAMIAASAMGVTDDERVDISSAARQLGDLLEEKGRSWAVYAEGYPGRCDPRRHIGRYARKHEPFISFKSVRADAARCARVKPASALDVDVSSGALADFSLYVPDLDDDGHDTGSLFASRWLEKSFGPRFEDPAFMKDLLVLVTFDEDGGTRDNRVYAVLLGPGVKPGTESDVRYDHYSIVRTAEDAFGLGSLGRGDATAAPFGGVWRDQ